MLNYFILFIILLAILPYLIFFILYTKFSLNSWIAFAIGGITWFVALILRSPILQITLYLPFYPQPLETILNEELLAISYAPWYIAFSSLMAGIFEEFFRFIVVKKIKLTSRNSKQLMSLGLGWGIGEAFLIHTLTLIFYLFTNLSDPLILIGAIERLIVIAFHTAMTFFVYKCIKDNSNKWTLVAVFLHFSLDFFGVLVFFYINIILGEIVLALITIIIILYLRVDYKKNPPSYRLEEEIE